MRIFFYGIGRVYRQRRDELTVMREDDTFLGFIDKRAAACRTFDGAHVYLPDEAVREDFDAIVVTAAAFGEIKEELCLRGVDEGKVYAYEEYFQLKIGDARTEYGDFGTLKGKKILMATPDIGYHGGALALLHAAIATQQAGYRVTLAAATIDRRLLHELMAFPIQVMEIPAIRFLSAAQLAFLQEYDAVVANVFPMVRFAVRTAQWRPVLWWLHECRDAFSETLDMFSETKDASAFSRLRIAAVSSLAQENFEAYYPGRVDTILPYCMPDSGREFTSVPQERVTFALIGGVCRRKAQDVFLDAVALLPERLRERAEFQLIGDSAGRDEYSADVRAMVAGNESICLRGVLTREEMQEAFRTIDVVACASREETMSLTITEGMMYGKVCITTDATGMADYIRSGENGFVVPTEDAKALARCMADIIEQPERYADMRAAARRTYEEHFTPKIFAARLTAELEKTVESWKEGPCG